MSYQLERALEREEQMLEDAYERGELSAKELSDELRRLHREYRDMAQEEAEDAYEAALGGNW